MTVRGLLLAAAFMASQPVDAAACHRYSRWYYPWAQSCGAAHHLVRLARSGPTWPGPDRAKLGQEEPDIPLPSLTSADLVGGEADEATRAHALLRAALEAANGQ